jgi:macrolide-specific efflux system membrane fusion protein
MVGLKERTGLLPDQRGAGEPLVGRQPVTKVRRRRRVLSAGLVVLLAAGGTGAWTMTRGGGGTAALGATSVVQTVSSQTIEQTVNASGTIEPADVADESFSVPGQITSVRVAVGDLVIKGQTLAVVDDTDLERAVEVAQANRDSAAAQLESAENNGGSATQIASAQSQLATAKDKLASAKDDLANATLRATIAGTVASVGIAKGDRVSGGGGGSSSSQVEIVGTSSWEVDASVSGTDLSGITKGQQVRITPSGATTQIYGTVSSVGVVASTASGGSSTFPVTIKVTGSPSDLHPGETATVVIVTKSVPDVLTVPTAALRTENGQTVVTKVVNGQDTTVAVVVGTAYGASTEVTSGLVDGDQVRVTVNRARTATGGSAGGTRNSGLTGGTGFTGAGPTDIPSGAFTGGANFQGGGPGDGFGGGN